MCIKIQLSRTINGQYSTSHEKFNWRNRSEAFNMTSIKFLSRDIE